MIIEKIKDAYKNFLNAHISVTMLRKNVLTVLSNKYIDRFENSCNEIKFSRYDKIRFLHEISTLLDLYDAYMIMAYR